MAKRKKNSDEPDLELIKDFARPWDREYPPVFSGRQEEIGIVEANCSRVFHRSQGGKKTGGHLVVFQGAPGAGKSSLLEHLEELWSRADPGSPVPVPQPLDLELETLANSEATARAIVKKVDPEKEEAFRNRAVKNATLSGGNPGIASGKFTAVKDTSPPEITLAALKETLPPKHWRRPLCLLVDEIQEVTKEHGASLQMLHQGKHGLPLVLIVAGLADSAEKLSQAGMSRLTTDNIYSLGALPAGEVQSCVKRMFEMCRVVHDPGQLAEIADGIVERSEGWPQHVRTETAALFGGLAKTEGILATVDHQEVAEQALAWREQSYRNRQGWILECSDRFVSNVLKTMPEIDVPPGQVLRFIDETSHRAESECEGLPEGVTPQEFLNHLIHRGVLQSNENGLLTCPIPSFRTWLIDRPDKVREISAGGGTAAASRVFEAGTAERPARRGTKRDGKDRDSENER